MAGVLRSLALLSASGASFALFLKELQGSWLLPFITSNTMTLEGRQRVIALMVVGALVAALAGVVVWWLFGRNRLRRVTHLTSPAILLGFLPPLLTTLAWTQLLNACVAIGTFLLVAERLIRMSIAAATEGQEPRPAWRSLMPRRLRRWLPLALVIAGAIGYGVYFSVFTLRMHGRFQTYNYDLGQYDNIFWTTLHGYPMRDYPLNLVKNWHELRDHASLSVFALLPFYAIKPGGAILLVIQSCVIGLGAIPVYRFAARRLPRSYAVVIAYAYLLYPPTHGMQFYDFHFQPIAQTFVLFVIDFVDDRRYWLCAVAFLIAVGCREDVSVGLAMLGAFLALSGRRLWPGIFIACGGAAYFVLMRFIIMPAFGSWGFQDVYKDLLPTGAHNFGGIISTMVSNPTYLFTSLATSEKLRYMLQILLPVALLPVRRSYLVMSVIPGSIFTILTTQYPPTIDIGFQYSAHFTPYVFAATAVCIAAFGNDGIGLIRRRAALVTLMLATVLTGVFWGAVPPRDHVHGGFSTMTMNRPTAADVLKDKHLKELHAMVPDDIEVSVAVSEAEMTHISRVNMKGLRDTTDADYLLYGTSSGYGGSSNAERALATGQFVKIAERPGLALLRRKTAAWPGPEATPQPPAAPPAPAPTLAPPVLPPVPAPAPGRGPAVGPGARVAPNLGSRVAPYLRPTGVEPNKPPRPTP